MAAGTARDAVVQTAHLSAPTNERVDSAKVRTDPRASLAWAFRHSAFREM